MFTGQEPDRRNRAQIADNAARASHTDFATAVLVEAWGRARAYRLIGADGRELLSSTPGVLGGHRRTRVYGRLDCPVAPGLIAREYDTRHRVFFADEATAIAAGYRPCGACMRDEYRRWKMAQDGPDA